METQEVLNWLYKEVIDKVLKFKIIDFEAIIKEAIAKDTLPFYQNQGLEVVEVEPPTEREIRRDATAALMPVTQRCVVSIFRAMFNPFVDGDLDSAFYSEDYLFTMDSVDWREFPKKVGFKGKELELRLIFSIALHTVANSHILKTRKVLVMDDLSFSVLCCTSSEDGTKSLHVVKLRPKKKTI